MRELYPHSQNPAWYNGVSPSGNWGERYSWHKQEIWKGRKSLLGFVGTTEWSGWGFKENMLGVKKWSAQEANAITDAMVFSTNTVLIFLNRSDLWILFRKNLCSITDSG